MYRILQTSLFKSNLVHSERKWMSSCSSCKIGCQSATRSSGTSDPKQGKPSPFNPLQASSSPTSKKSDGTPFRHPLDWKSPSFYDPKEIDKEMRRVFDICNGCRLCFNLCDSFPKLFDVIDKSPTGELDSVPSSSFKDVVDKCTMCDMCFIAKCPYVPPHSFEIDFPHLMLRYRAAENKAKNEAHIIPETSKEVVSPPKDDVDHTLTLKPPGKIHDLMTDVDKIAPVATSMASITNWAVSTHSAARKLIDPIAGIHPDAEIPKYVPKSEIFMNQIENLPLKPNPNGPSFGKRKVVLYATCLVNYNKPEIGLAARKVLNYTGVEVKEAYTECCGMPQLESGNIAEVTKRAKSVAASLNKYLEDGYEVVTLVSSCSLMFKQEWPNFLPDDPLVKKLSENTCDISEYIVKIAKKEGRIEGLQNVSEPVSLHHACHARAQNMGFKARDMLKLIPGIKLNLVERCSGHGGSFGVKKETFETAMAVGKPVFTKVKKDIEKNKETIVASECPLAAEQIKHGTQYDAKTKHPIEILAQSYKL